MKLLCEFSRKFSVRYEVGWVYIVLGLFTITFGVSSWKYRKFGVYKWTWGKWTKYCSYGYRRLDYEQYLGRFRLDAFFEKYKSYDDLEYFFLNN